MRRRYFMKEARLRNLLKSIPKMELGQFPTPLHALDNLAKELKSDIYIKREDLSGLGPGGNKIRILEYIMGEALRQKSDAIIASGPMQSNLCTSVACACAKLGLEAVLIHNGEKPQTFTANLLLNRLLGARTIFLGPVSKEERNAHMPQVCEELKAQGKTPFIIENGGCTGFGILGYMTMVMELYQQCQEKGFRIKTIFTPAGNGSIASGLVFANTILEQPYSIVVVSTEYQKERLLQNMRKTIAEAEEILSIPFTHDLNDVCTVTDEYYGGGWGKNTPESEAAVLSLPKTEGIFIENVYTSKTYVAMCDFIAKGKVQEGVCYLHSGGFSSLFAQFV
jgi:1-aminocyclopropane-1-carboxylate deaminase/D-cysteine desulfhydrase-like pyridoxal-dependent ACC family enzyme